MAAGVGPRITQLIIDTSVFYIAPASKELLWSPNIIPFVQYWNWLFSYLCTTFTAYDLFIVFVVMRKYIFGLCNY